MDDFALAQLLIEVVAQAGGLGESRGGLKQGVAALRSHRSHPTLVKLRDTARFLIRKRTSLSLPEIGSLFKQDHSSIHSAIRREQQRLDRGLVHAPSGLTWKAWHDHIYALLDQRLEKIAPAPSEVST